jgi:predicted glutamine amidotransferase
MDAMCRLFGMSAGARRAAASFWLLDAPDSLAVQSHREPDGTGLGWFDEEARPHVSKQPIAAYGDAQFAHRAQSVHSRTFVAHIRFASTGGLAARNTHPFEQEGRLFAHNGVVEGLPALEERIGEDMRFVHGETDSERLFALITRETASAAGDLAAGIEAACRWVAAELPLLAINFVLACADGVWALRYPDVHELHVLERQAGAPLEHRSARFGTKVSCDDANALPLVTIASERMDDDPGWRELRSGELLHVSGALEVSSRVILDGPPAHPLSLADLPEHARASQAATPA